MTDSTQGPTYYAEFYIRQSCGLVKTHEAAHDSVASLGRALIAWSTPNGDGQVIVRTVQHDGATAATKKLAREFARVLASWLTPEQMQTVVTRNESPEYAEGDHYSVCASHDFCDANEAMLQAFATVYGREMKLGDDDDDGSDMEAVNAAWDLARRSRFWVR